MHATSAIPVRAILALVGTALGLALLFSFRTPDVAPLTAGGRGNAPIPSPTRPATAAGGGVAVGASDGGGARPTPPTAPTTGTLRNPNDRTTSGSTAAPATPGATTARPPAATAAPTVAPATPRPTAQPASGDVTGPTEQTPFGNVQVEVKVVGGQIVDVVALQLPNDRRRSAQISQYVAPILHDEALQAQSASIDLISGATWTSGAYQASLQAALAKISG